MIFLPTVVPAKPDNEEREFMKTLYEQNNKLMFAVAWKYLHDPMRVQDVVSQSCVKLMENIDTLRTLEEPKLRAYIVRVVRNNSINYIKKRNSDNTRCKSIDNYDELNIPVEHDFTHKIALEEELSLVMSAIDSLPEKERDIMRMKFSMNMSDEEIAKKVSLSTASIRQYIRRARKRLKEIVYEK